MCQIFKVNRENIAFDIYRERGRVVRVPVFRDSYITGSSPKLVT